MGLLLIISMVETTAFCVLSASETLRYNLVLCDKILRQTLNRWFFNFQGRLVRLH